MCKVLSSISRTQTKQRKPLQKEEPPTWGTTLRLSSHVGPIFNGELSVSCVPVTLGTPFVGATHLVRKWRVCSNTSGFPAKRCPPSSLQSNTHFLLSLTRKCKLCLSSLHPEVPELKSAWEKEQKWRTQTHHLTKQGRGEGTKEERKRGGREGKNNHEISGRKLVQLPVESRIWRKKGRLQSDFPAKDRAGFPPPRSSPCEPWMEHYTKKLVHICYHFLRSPLPGLVGTLIIQGVHLCSCHAGCSLWSAKQLKGKSQTLGCLGRERKEELLLFAQIFMFPESRLPSPNATCSERMAQSQFHLAFLLN